MEPLEKGGFFRGLARARESFEGTPDNRADFAIWLNRNPDSIGIWRSHKISAMSEYLDECRLLGLSDEIKELEQYLAPYIRSK